MKEKRIPSVIPIYGFGVVWVLYCLIFPLSRWWQLLLCAGLSFLTWLILKKIFPGDPVPEAPLAEADPELADLTVRGKSAVAEFRALNEAIPDEGVTHSLTRIETLTDQIFQKAATGKGSTGQLRRFMDYYLPTTLKLVRRYRELQSAPMQTGNVARAKARIGELLRDIEGAFQTQLDNLYENDYVDITADIQVMETLLEQEGLTEKTK